MTNLQLEQENFQFTSCRRIFVRGKNRLKKGWQKAKAGREPQLTLKETKRLLEQATKKVESNPLEYAAPHRANWAVKKTSRTVFAWISAADRNLKLTWTKFGTMVRRAEAIPHGKRYWRGLRQKKETKNLVKGLEKAVENATLLSYL